MQVLQKNAVQGLAVRTRSLFAPRLPSTVARNQTPFQASKGSTAFVATTSVVPVLPAFVCLASATDDATYTEEDLSQSSSIFISNLAYATDNEALDQALSSRVDGLRRANVIMRDGRSRGMAIADFESPEAAQHAVRELHETDIDGRTINVRIAAPRPPRQDRRFGERGGDRFGRGDRGDRYADRGAPRGDRYGGEQQERRFDRRGPNGEPREPRAPRDPETLLYVGNLSWSTTWQEVKEAFVDAGLSVEFADVKKTPEGRSKGFAIVAMSDAGGAERAVEQMNDLELGGRRINVRRFEQQARS